jgi:hypothetical protein
MSKDASPGKEKSVDIQNWFAEGQVETEDHIQQTRASKYEKLVDEIISQIRAHKGAADIAKVTFHSLTKSYGLSDKQAKRTAKVLVQKATDKITKLSK